MVKLNKKNLFIEINDENLLIAVGEHDDELNFKIIDKEKIFPSGFKNGKIINLEVSIDKLKKTIKKIENRSNLLFSDANVIINQTDLNCVNVSGFKKLNGNQILSEDISYILNDVKSKLVESEKYKTIIHLFNTKYLLDNKPIKNLPIGLYGDFYSHQLTFFLIKDNELKNLRTIFNRCNLSLNKIILKSFTEGIKIIKKNKIDTFIKIEINENDSNLIFFSESAFCYFQKFNFGSDMILKDISKVCSLEISKVRNIISENNFVLSSENMYVDKKYFDEKNFRKISFKHITEILSARIEEIANIIFNKNQNLNYLKNIDAPFYLDFKDKNTLKNFKSIIKNHFNEPKLNFDKSIDEDPFESIKIFGDLLCKGWIKEAIPVVSKKRSWISRIFSGLFE
tara:strand:- start:727 stop:1917 length:1191 start_codon:yes stop_codon:yes gene_type:complete